MGRGNEGRKRLDSVGTVGPIKDVNLCQSPISSFLPFSTQFSLSFISDWSRRRHQQQHFAVCSKTFFFFLFLLFRLSTLPVAAAAARLLSVSALLPSSSPSPHLRACAYVGVCARESVTYEMLY